MGHTRLSIIDLATGDQPLVSAGGATVLTANGEFYDSKVIRTRMACEGVRFSTKSDSEIALHLYRRHGLGFVHQLRGEFAFALFDAANKLTEVAGFDKDDMVGALGAVGGACKGCHDTYRED